MAICTKLLPLKEEKKVYEEAYFWHTVNNFVDLCRVHGTKYMNDCLSTKGIKIKECTYKQMLSHLNG